MENTAKKHVGHAFTQFELTNYLLNNLSQFNLTPIAKLVLLELSVCFNPNKPDMFPKQKTLAKKIGVSERSVVRGVQELVKAGLILIESKYTNHYVFTSKISEKLSQNEKNFYFEKMSEDLRQNDIKKDENLSEHEQIAGQNKEPGKVEDFKILKKYAENKGAKNVRAYINALKRNGSANKIIQEEKAKKAIEKYHEKQVEETKQKIAGFQTLKGENPRDCELLQAVLKQIKSPTVY